MEETKIMIVEDDTDLSGIMRDFLYNEGYQVLQVYSGTEAIETAKTFHPTLIILDIMLPGADGIEVCRNIRTHSFCPIIVISAKSTDSDKLLSLGVGADDYMTKPFSIPELLGRVKSQIRRFTAFNQQVPVENKNKRVFGKLTIDADNYSACVEGRQIPLTSKEFKLLDFLSAHPKQVFTKEQLLDHVWGYNEFIDESAVHVYIGRLREKLSKEQVSYIKTVWGVGYKWEM
jgi:DNA-binding response OmpR family regulator